MAGHDLDNFLDGHDTLNWHLSPRAPASVTASRRWGDAWGGMRAGNGRAGRRASRTSRTTSTLEPLDPLGHTSGTSCLRSGGGGARGGGENARGGGESDLGDMGSPLTIIGACGARASRHALRAARR